MRPIVDSIDQRRVVTGSILVDDQVSVFVPGASAALAFGPAFGVVGTIQYVQETGGDKIVGTAGEQGITFGAAVDLDLNPGTPVPIGFLLAYSLTEPIGDDGIDRTQQLDGGISTPVVRNWSSV